MNRQSLLHETFKGTSAPRASLRCQMGSGVLLRSLGSNGGLDIVALILLQRYNLGLGKTYFIFNLALYLTSMAFLENEIGVMARGLVSLLTAGIFFINKIKIVFTDKCLPGKRSPYF